MQYEFILSQSSLREDKKNGCFTNKFSTRIGDFWDQNVAAGFIPAFRIAWNYFVFHRGDKPHGYKIWLKTGISRGGQLRVGLFGHYRISKQANHTALIVQDDGDASYFRDRHWRRDDLATQGFGLF